VSGSSVSRCTRKSTDVGDKTCRRCAMRDQGRPARRPGHRHPAGNRSGLSWPASAVGFLGEGCYVSERGAGWRHLRCTRGASPALREEFRKRGVWTEG
jgi:hypothetical protein